ncbi:hypothetical protein [Sodalis-like endosymbiont of Proechinophthirus fluctus]|uniref:hypothetical protein n=1 Tax=Sodalis-like endosymbiont of Proechinophthirus fluctus TaxID=1462730 RepID=UPI000AC19573|nr:hypothetical protein [Sodalis-like endosymbiont of Proechinophthirus fluctus]
MRSVGHVVDCRINTGKSLQFPTPGLVMRWQPPGSFSMCIDSHVTTGYWVPPYYDYR